MRVQDDPPIHLTYCMNVHPGETWPENFAAIREYAAAVRDKVFAILPARPFGLGLRLSAQAAEQISRPRAIAELKDYLRDSGMYVFTINGFPYGRFHDGPVKTDVYSPDWREPARLKYTNTLADILAELLPEGVSGSISTVPGSYKEWVRDEQDAAVMARMMAQAALHLDAIRRRTGKEIILALEPEPDCCIETVEETVRFFEEVLDAAGDRAIIRRHVGVCFDTSHMAVEFEDLTRGLRRLLEAGVRVAKVHLSSALCLRPTAAALEQLGQFRDTVYLHQVKVRSADGDVTSYPDLPEALEAGARAPDRNKEWRVHFHVPLFFEAMGDLRSTSDLFDDEFVKAIRSGATGHLEIETYTFGVLPEPLRPRDLTDGIAKEYEWVLERFFDLPC